MKILVTGGAGYIGSHTCIELLHAGYEVVIIDNFANSSPAVVEKIKRISGHDFDFVQADLRDKAALRALFGQHQIDAVIHFAGLKAVGESVSMPLEYYDNNINGTLVLLEEMRAHGVRRIVFSSSATVYGNDNPVPFREEYPTSATNPYGYTKVVIERILEDLAVSDPSWSICNLRYFNPIGAHKSGLIGEDPNDIPNNLFPYILQVAAGIRDKVHIFGDDYPTRDGTGVRDYIHVMDLARGHLSALDYTQSHTGAKAINLGTGKGTSVLELIHAFEAATGITIPHQVDGRRPGDIAEGYADPSLAKDILHWTAQCDLNDMCADGWNFARQRYAK